MIDQVTRGDAPWVRLERLVPAPPADVYAAWTDPTLLGQWMSPFGHAEVALDLRVGGALHVVMVDAEARIEHSGEFLELDPPHRLRFTWVSPYTGSVPSIVTVVLEQDGDQTRLVLVHEQLPADVVASHERGWGVMVDRLAAVVAAMPAQEEVVR